MTTLTATIHSSAAAGATNVGIASPVAKNPVLATRASPPRTWATVTTDPDQYAHAGSAPLRAAEHDAAPKNATNPKLPIAATAEPASKTLRATFWSSPEVFAISKAIPFRTATPARSRPMPATPPPNAAADRRPSPPSAARR